MMREMETLRKFGKMLGSEGWLPGGETTSGRLHRTPSKMFLFPLQNTELQMHRFWKECQIRYWSVESMSIISLGHESHDTMVVSDIEVHEVRKMKSFF